MVMIIMLVVLLNVACFRGGEERMFLFSLMYGLYVSI